MILGHFKNFPKLRALIFSGLVITAAVLVFAYYPKNSASQKSAVLGVSQNSFSSSKLSSQSLSSSSIQSLASQSSMDSSSESSVSSSVLSSKNTSSKASSTASSSSSLASSAASRMLTLTGARCNGPDEGNPEIDYICRAYDSGTEVGTVPFNFYINNPTPPLKTYIQKGKIIDDKQYIYETTGGSNCICGVHIHAYDFNTKSLDYADMLSFNPLNETGISGEPPVSLIEWVNEPGCADMKSESSWIYSCFYALDKDPSSSNTDDYEIKRNELNDIEKAKIDIVKTSYFNYQIGLEKYGVPNYVTKYCAQGWTIGG